MAQKKEGKILGLERETWRSFMGKYGVSVIMVIMIIAIEIYNPRFLSGSNLINVITQISINGMMAFGMCLCITIGGIDLTVGAQLALVGVIMGQTITNHGWPIAAGILIGVAVATLFGFINGFFIAKFNMFPFVVTLSMQLVIRGAAQVISGGKAITFGQGVKNLYYGQVPWNRLSDLGTAGCICSDVYHVPLDQAWPLHPGCRRKRKCSCCIWCKRSKDPYHRTHPFRLPGWYRSCYHGS